MNLPRHITQPGPVAETRLFAVEGRGKSFSFTLEPGILLVEAVRRGFAAHGFVTGTVEFAGTPLAPFTYVTPALSKTGENAAFYSDFYRPAGVSRIDTGAMTFGLRDGAPFYHFHALWTEPDGTTHGGHVIPEETVVAEAAIVTALGIDGALFEGNPDPEINFKIFGPVPAASTGVEAPLRVVAMRLKPNQDFCGALEAWCETHNIARARIRGGVGSTIGVRFADGREVSNFATEVYIHHGYIGRGLDGRPEAFIDIGVVDYTGAVAKGVLRRGDNPVLMTFELALEVLA